eukprot:symbB.v1.2.034403.t1/scaffold4434.1/size39729/1
MSLIHQLSRATAQAKRDAAERKRLYDLETERLVQAFVATWKEKFTEACWKAARNQKNECCIDVFLSKEVEKRAGGKNVTEQKLRAMLVELGFPDGRVQWFAFDPFGSYFEVSATWPVADAAGQASKKRRRRTSPERAGGTFITCPICQEHRPAVVLIPCGHVVCRDCQRCQKFRRCPMCRGPVSRISSVATQKEDGHCPRLPRHTNKAMSFLRELSQTTRDAAESKRLYDLETERLVQAFVATHKERFMEACRKATQNERNRCSMAVYPSDEFKKRDGEMGVMEQKLQAMLVELGFHDGGVGWNSACGCFAVSAKWPVADVELSQSTAQAQRDAAESKRLYELETEGLVQPLVAAAKARFMEACRKAAQNQQNGCRMQVKTGEKVGNRNGGKGLMEQKLRAMLLELGFHDGGVEWKRPCYFHVSATWPVAARSKKTSPQQAGGTSITCPICQEHRPAEHISPMKLQTCEDNLQLCNSGGAHFSS